MGLSTVFLAVTIVVLHSNVESALTILSDETLTASVDQLVPENRTLTHLLEQRLGRNNFLQSVGCSINQTITPLTRNGIRNTKSRWRYFKVYADSVFDEKDQTLIKNAMYRLSQVIPCVTFTFHNKTPSGDYIHIKDGSGCSSWVGRIGGRQELHLARYGCMFVGGIMHEFMHALGFYHEHARPDRDKYVTIHWKNITKGMEGNFAKLDSRNVDTFGVPYNPRSIMHYRHNEFGITNYTNWMHPYRTTITTKDGGIVGPTWELEDTDKLLLQRMYKCGGN